MDLGVWIDKLAAWHRGPLPPGWTEYRVTMAEMLEQKKHGSALSADGILCVILLRKGARFAPGPAPSLNELRQPNRYYEDVGTGDFLIWQGPQK